MSITTETRFDFGAYRAAVEGKDIAAQTRLFAEDAELTVVDAKNPPRSPLLLSGREAIGKALDAWETDGLTHRIEQDVVGNDRVAYTQRCRYPEGLEVLLNVMLEVRDGEITRALVVQAYDE